MRLKTFFLTISVVAIGLIGCGKGFEPVKIGGAAGSGDNRILSNGGPSVVEEAPVEIPENTANLEQVFYLRAMALEAPGEDNRLVLNVLAQKATDVLNLKVVFDPVDGHKSQKAKPENITGMNLETLAVYDASTDALRFDLKCISDCDYVSVRASSNSSPRIINTQFKLVKLEPEDELGFYVVQESDEAAIQGTNSVGYEKVVEQVRAEIVKKRIDAILADEESEEEVETQSVSEVENNNLNEQLGNMIDSKMNEKLKTDLETQVPGTN